MTGSLALLLGLLLGAPTGLGASLPMAPVNLTGHYTIGAGDTIMVEVFNEPSLTLPLLVSTQGTITYPLLGQVAVEGLTTDQVSEEIQRRLAADYLVRPQVSTRVTTYGSRPVQVLGAVKSPGLFYLTGPTTLHQMLALAGGIVVEKASREVRVIRSGGGEPLVINLEKLLADETDLWSLKAGDLVYVPEGAMVYVSGQVTKPGPVLFTDGITLTQALNAAGGPLPTARLRTAFILRDGVRTVVKLKRILRGQELDITLRPGDQIFLEQAVF